MTLEEQLKLDDGHRFQKKLGELVTETKSKVIMETGSGVSSIYMLKALDDVNIDGKVHSIDIGMWYPHKIDHPKFDQIKAKSVEAILPLYLSTGAFDIAVSDGCHEILEQTYEYEMMFATLKPGGYLIIDDANWNNNGAWQAFLDRYNLKDDYFGDARIIQKRIDLLPLGVEYNYTFGDPVKTFNESVVYGFHTKWLAHCEQLEKEWLAAGNKKHPAFE